jgi:hypothetical protein
MARPEIQILVRLLKGIKIIVKLFLHAKLVVQIKLCTNFELTHFTVN